MSTIKTLSIKQPSGSGFDSRDIGAEAQYIDVSYDSNGNIIEDITAPGVVVDHTESTAKALKDINTDMSDKAPKSHASITDVYGAASETEYGHVKIGTGLLNTSGTVSVHYGNTSETACEGNDSRLSDTRNTTNSLTFNNGGSGATSGTTFNGSEAKTISYNTVGAAPKSHASTTTDYGVASSTNYGHVKTGTGINNSSGTISVSYGTAEGTACQGNDSRLSNARNTPNSITFNNGGSGAGSGTTFNGSVARTVSYNTIGAAPTSHASTSTTYGGGTASNYGHVKLSDTYTSNVGAAANSIAASQTALYNVYHSLKPSNMDIRSIITPSSGVTVYNAEVIKCGSIAIMYLFFAAPSFSHANTILKISRTTALNNFINKSPYYAFYVPTCVGIGENNGEKNGTVLEILSSYYELRANGYFAATDYIRVHFLIPRIPN